MRILISNMNIANVLVAVFMVIVLLFVFKYEYEQKQKKNKKDPAVIEPVVFDVDEEGNLIPDFRWDTKYRKPYVDEYYSNLENE